VPPVTKNAALLGNECAANSCWSYLLSVPTAIACVYNNVNSALAAINTYTNVCLSFHFIALPLSLFATNLIIVIKVFI
jgi:hypothetical protein